MSKSFKVILIICGGLVAGSLALFLVHKGTSEKELQAIQVNISEEYIEHGFDDIELKISYPPSFSLEIPKEQNPGFTVAAILRNTIAGHESEKLTIVYYEAPTTSSVSSRIVSDEAVEEYKKNKNIKLIETGAAEFLGEGAEYIVYSISDGEGAWTTKEIFLVYNGRVFNLIFTADSRNYAESVITADKIFASFSLAKKESDLDKKQTKNTEVEQAKPASSAPKQAANTENKTPLTQNISYSLGNDYYAPKNMKIKFFPITGWKLEEATGTDYAYGDYNSVIMYESDEPEQSSRKKSFRIMYARVGSEQTKWFKEEYSADDIANDMVKSYEDELNYYKVEKYKKVSLAGKEFYYIEASYVRDNGKPAKTTNYMYLSPTMLEMYVISIYAEKDMVELVYPILEKAVNSLMFY